MHASVDSDASDAILIREGRETMSIIHTIDEAIAHLNRTSGQTWTEAGQKASRMAREAVRPVAQASDWQARNRARALAWEAERAAKR